MTFNQLQLIFRAHLQVIVIIMFVVLFGALVTAFLIPKSYTAKATLVIDVRSPDSVFGNSGLPLTSPAYMNTQAEIHQAFSDYQRTRFGGWPWQNEAPHHGAERGRFARHPDGREEAAR